MGDRYDLNCDCGAKTAPNIGGDEWYCPACGNQGDYPWTVRPTLEIRRCSYVARIPTADEIRAGRIAYCLNVPTVVESHTDDGCPNDRDARPELMLSWSCGGPHRFAEQP